MHSAIRRISLAAILLMLASPALGRTATQSNSPQGTGEAASQERKETSVDAEVSAGSARKASTNGPRKHTTLAQTKAAAVQRTSTSKHRTAQLKTGQLTSGQSAKLQTKQTTMHRAVPTDGDDASNQSAAGAKAKSSKPSNDIHLKKHNARMF